MTLPEITPETKEQFAPTPEKTQKIRVLQMCAVDFTVRQFLLPLASKLTNSGYDVTVACSRGPYFDEIRELGTDIRENPISRSFSIPAHLRSLWRTYRLLRRESFDVLHVHTPIAALIGRIAGWMARVPVRIYTAHGFYFHERMPASKRRFHVWLEKIGARFGNFIMTVSREDEQTAIALGIARPDDIETIYNGVDLNRFNPDRYSPQHRQRLRAEYNIPPDSIVVGIVGRMVREKGFFEFLDAARVVAAKHPQTHFLIVGDTLPSDHDGSRSEILDHMNRLGIADRLSFAGLVADTVPYLAMMDIFCLPSYREGMPVSLLEAMAMELACIATDIRGCREEITDGETGWLVPVQDANALAEKISWYIENPQPAAEMGRRARALVAEAFDIEQVLQHQIRIYNRLTAHLRD